MKHKLRSQHWAHGSLREFEKEFERLEDALEFAIAYVENLAVEVVVKIYNELGELVHHRHHHSPDYA